MIFIHLFFDFHSFKTSILTLFETQMLPSGGRCHKQLLELVQWLTHSTSGFFIQRFQVRITGWFCNSSQQMKLKFCKKSYWTLILKFYTNSFFPHVSRRGMPHPIVNPLGSLDNTSKISVLSLNLCLGYKLPRISKSRRHLLYFCFIIIDTVCIIWSNFF